MSELYPFHTLPDYLRVGLKLIFIGINPGLYSVERGHYFARSTSRFWPAFSASKLSEPVRRSLRVKMLGPQDDVKLLRYGIGFTDVIKRPSANAAELGRKEFEDWVPRLLGKLRQYSPSVACFHGLTGYRPFLKIGLGCPGSQPVLGVQPEHVGVTRIFVVPNPSPANAHFTPGEQAAWYDRLADFLAQT